MRIIDKNKDFYDYIQYLYNDSYFTFDRRDSFVLTKEDIYMILPLFNRRGRYYKSEPCLLLQINHTFWLFSINIIEKERNYKLELVGKWEDRNSKRELIKLSILDVDLFRNESLSIQLIQNGRYKVWHVFDHHIVMADSYRVEKHIPILTETGIASCVDAFEIYNTLEEYFSEEKTASERTEPIGATNNDKITAHGFDLVSSFRG